MRWRTMLKNWIGDRFFDGDTQAEHVSMKPVISKLLKEAFRIALAESIPDIDDERRCAIFMDYYKITDEEMCRMDLGALCQNIFVRMFGTGGFVVRGMYNGNASPQESFDACVAKPDITGMEDIEEFLRGQGYEVVDE